MYKKLMLGCVLLMFAAPGMAAESKASGGYIGGGLGNSRLDDDGAFDGLSFDDTDTTAQIVGGYKFNKYFALEARYSDYGSFSVMGLGIDASAMSIHGVASIPFGASGWELFLQGGFGRVSLDVPGESTDESAFGTGIGIRYSFTENLSLAAQTDLFIWDDSDGFSDYTLSVGGTILSIQYIF